jgi:hypothetical protein
VHDTSHAHDVAHRARRRHELGPLQVTSQAPSPQRISSPQLEMPVQRTSHDAAVPHVMRWVHALSPHSTRHGTLAGQTTSAAAQLPLALQSITHTPAGSQVPLVQPIRHSAGADASVTASGGPGGPSGVTAGSPQRACPGIAHQPSLQRCPPVHSVAAAHCTVQSRSAGS